MLDGAVASLKDLPSGRALPGGARAPAQLAAQCASLRRGQPAVSYMRAQRGALAAAGVLEGALRAALARPAARALEVGQLV